MPLGDERLLHLKLLVRDQMLFMQAANPVQIAACAGQLRIALLQLAFGLRETNAIGGRIDLSEKIAAFNALTFLKNDAQQLAVHLTFNGHRVERCHRSDRLNMHGQVT